MQDGTLSLTLSLKLAAIASGLAAPGASPRGVWRRGWPVFQVSAAAGLLAVVAG